MQAYVRFYAELNDYLPEEQRYKPVVNTFEGRHTVGDVIAFLGVPHAEVDLILVNGTSVDNSHVVCNCDRVSVYPVFESFDITELTRLRPKPLRQPRFVLDVHLGKLAYYLRMLGFDVLYRNDFQDEELIDRSLGESRILLSKDRELLANEQVTRGYCVLANHPPEQVTEVLKRFDLFGSVSPLQRCIRCNSILQPIEKSEVIDRLPAMVAKSYNEFQRCPNCNRVYWKGSQYARMEAFITTILNSQDQPGQQS